MFLKDLNPFVRFAASVRNGVMSSEVKVTDCRIFYVEQGQVRIHIAGKTFELKENSLFYCHAGGIYRAERLTDLQMICINFDLSRTWEQEALPLPVLTQPAQWPEMAVYQDQVEDSSFLDTYLIVRDASQLREHLQKLCQTENSNLGDLLRSSLMKLILLQLHSLREQTLPPKLALIMEYIRSHYKEPISNKQLGQLAGYHEYYLNRSFAAYTGMTIHRYLLKVRMEQAAYLLLNTELPLGMVAEEVGIRSYPHFSASFKATYGCSPTQYRGRI